MNVCNICGGNSFGTGPGGRLSALGKNPRCETCQSLERHRSFREFFLKFKDPSYELMNVLQFSKDASVDPSWFHQYKCSIYGSKTSLDLQKIDEESGEYDLIICNHVLEHVKYDNAALNELVRLLKFGGTCFLTVPDPFRLSKTSDWDYAKEDQHGHYRMYGADIVDRFSRYVPTTHIVRVNIIDSVTGTEDHAFLISKFNNSFVQSVLESDLPCKIIQAP